MGILKQDEKVIYSTCLGTCDYVLFVFCILPLFFPENPFLQKNKVHYISIHSVLCANSNFVNLGQISMPDYCGLLKMLQFKTVIYRPLIKKMLVPKTSC
jgi:hypothetical protein